MSSFPLFRLPLLPIKSTLDMMDISEKINLSMSSMKTYQFFKTTKKSVPIESLSEEHMENLSALDKINFALLEIHSDSEEFFQNYRISIGVAFSDNISYRFTIYNINSMRILTTCNIHVNPNHKQKWWFEGSKGNLKIGNANVPVLVKCGLHMYTIWDDKLEGFQTIGDWFKKIFKPQINIEIRGGIKKDYSENLRFVINSINSTYRGSVQSSIVRSYYKISDEGFKFILDNVHPIESLKLFVERCAGFQHDPLFKSDNLKLIADWFTLDNLFTTECRNISLSESTLTFEDLREYLKQWLAGRFTNLKCLHVKTQKELEVEQIIHGLLSGSLRVNDQLVNYTFTCRNKIINFKRNDGKVAKIRMPDGQVKQFDMNVSSN